MNLQVCCYNFIALKKFHPNTLSYSPRVALVAFKMCQLNELRIALTYSKSTVPNIFVVRNAWKMSKICVISVLGIQSKQTHAHIPCKLFWELFKTISQRHHSCFRENNFYVVPADSYSSVKAGNEQCSLRSSAKFILLMDCNSYSILHKVTKVTSEKIPLQQNISKCFKSENLWTLKKFYIFFGFSNLNFK